MVIIKAVFIFFVGILAIKRILDIGDTNNDRTAAKELMYCVEVALCIGAVIFLFKI